MNISASETGEYKVGESYLTCPGTLNGEVLLSVSDDSNFQIWATPNQLSQTGLSSQESDTATPFFLQSVTAENAPVIVVNDGAQSYWDVEPSGAHIELLNADYSKSGYYLNVGAGKVVVKSTKQAWVWNKKVMKGSSMP